MNSEVKKYKVTFEKDCSGDDVEHIKELFDNDLVKNFKIEEIPQETLEDRERDKAACAHHALTGE
jgi:hypothetical protein